MLICLSFSSATAQSNRITGKIFIDKDSDGVFDAFDIREGAITVELYRDNNTNGTIDAQDTQEATEITDALGDYEFAGLPAGQYLIQVDEDDMPPGWTWTNGNLQSSVFLTANGGTDNFNDFGYIGKNVGCLAFAASGDRLYVFNRFTSTNKPVGSTSNGSNIQAMAISPNGKTLWAVNNVPQNNRVGRVNRSTGQFSPLPNDFGTAGGSRGNIVLDSVFGISFDFATGELYGLASVSGNNLLFKVDTVSGSFINDAFGQGNDYLEISSSGGDKENDDIAFNPSNGKLYALQQDAGSGGNGIFVTINLQNGSVQQVGNSSIDNIEGLTFARDGTFIGTTGLSGQIGNSYVEIDEASGNVTLIAPFASGGGDFEACACFSAGINLPPRAFDDFVSTQENVNVDVDVLANDSTQMGDPITTDQILTGPQNGTASILPNDEIRYEPNANFTGMDSLEYEISDTANATSSAWVYITVVPGPVSPTAVDDVVTTPEDTPVTIDVQLNDIDPSNNGLTTRIVSPPSNGTASVLNGDEIYYNPDTDFFGLDTLRYRISDGQGGRDTAFVFITVTPVNDTPELQDDYATTMENTPVDILVLLNDFDADGDPLTVTSIVTQPNDGTVMIMNGDSIRYTPNMNFVGFDTLFYEACDPGNLCDQARVVIKVNNVNDDPIARNDRDTTLEDTPIVIDVQINDEDPNNDPLTTSIVTPPSNGTATVINGDSILYTPALNFVGLDTLFYQACDPTPLCDPARVIILVRRVNDLPVAVDDFTTTPEQTPVNVDVQANDIDPDNDPLTTDILISPTQGFVTILNGDSITYTPGPTFSGLDSLNYEICDGSGGCDDAWVYITVIGMNDRPTARNDFELTWEDTPVTIDVLDNDTDPENDPLTTTIIRQPMNGTATILNADSILYRPDPGFAGARDSVLYAACDPFNACDSAWAIITVLNVNSFPIAIDDYDTTSIDMPVLVDVQLNDVDPDGDNLTTTQIVSFPSNGSVTIQNGDEIEYTPNTGYAGQDTFFYEVCDGNGGCDQAFVYMTILDPGLPPVAVNDTLDILNGTPTLIDVQVNDFDPDGDPILTTDITSLPGNGQVQIVNDNQVLYTSDDNYFGPDQFTYQICDNRGLCDEAVVFLTIVPDRFVLPTGITPNDDGFNDAYVILGLDLYPDNELVVYNRWGNIVYDQEDYNNTWRGINNNGEILPDGTYYVIFRSNTDDFSQATYVDLRR